MMFENYCVCNYVPVNRAVAPIQLSQNGSSTGLVIHVGGGTVTVAPVVDSVAKPADIQTGTFAGD